MTRLNQTITRWQGMGLIATTMLGTGVFILPQLTIGAAGNLAIWAWIILLIAILPLALIFAELGKQFTHAAGPAYFVERAFSNSAGKTTGLLFLIAVPPGAAAAMIITFEFLTPLITLSDKTLLVAQIVTFISIFLLNLRGLNLSAKLQLVLTISIVLVVGLMLIAAVITEPDFQNPIITPEPHGSADLLTAIGLAIWSFLGIEALTHLSGEFRNVKRDFVPATVGGISLVGVIFMASTWLSSFAPGEGLAIVAAYEQLIGSEGRWIIACLGLISGLATINVYIASLSRLVWSFADQNVLPSGLAYKNKAGVPIVALCACIASSSLILIISYKLNLDFIALAHWVNGAFVAIYTLSMLAAWKLLSYDKRPWIILSLVACALFVYCLGSPMLYILAIAVVLYLVLELKNRLKTEGLRI